MIRIFVLILVLSAALHAAADVVCSCDPASLVVDNWAISGEASNSVAAPGNNFAVNQSFFAPTNFNASYACDSTLTYGWAATEQPAWVQLQFGVAVSPTRIRIFSSFGLESPFIVNSSLGVLASRTTLGDCTHCGEASFDIVLAEQPGPDTVIDMISLVTTDGCCSTQFMTVDAVSLEGFSSCSCSNVTNSTSGNATTTTSSTTTTGGVSNTSTTTGGTTSSSTTTGGANSTTTTTGGGSSNTTTTTTTTTSSSTTGGSTPTPSVVPVSQGPSPSESAPCPVNPSFCKKNCLREHPSQAPPKEPRLKYFTIHVDFPCPGLIDPDCCEFYQSLPNVSAADWLLCDRGSSEDRKPSFDPKVGRCSLFMYAPEGEEGIDETEFEDAADSVQSAFCQGDTACSVKAKAGQSLSYVYSSGASLLATIVLLVLAVVTIV